MDPATATDRLHMNGSDVMSRPSTAPAGLLSSAEQAGHSAEELAVVLTSLGWTFPVYVLASHYEIDPGTGLPRLDDRLRLFAPAMHVGSSEGDVERQVAIFTNFPLAEECLEKSEPENDLAIIRYRTPAAIVPLLRRASGTYRSATIDPLALQGFRSRSILLEEMIARLESLSGS